MTENLILDRELFQPQDHRNMRIQALFYRSLLLSKVRYQKFHGCEFQTRKKCCLIHILQNEVLNFFDFPHFIAGYSNDRGSKVRGQKTVNTWGDKLFPSNAKSFHGVLSVAVLKDKGLLDLLVDTFQFFKMRLELVNGFLVFAETRQLILQGSLKYFNNSLLLDFS